MTTAAELVAKYRHWTYWATMFLFKCGCIVILIVMSIEVAQTPPQSPGEWVGVVFVFALYIIIWLEIEQHTAQVLWQALDYTQGNLLQWEAV